MQPFPDAILKSRIAAISPAASARRQSSPARTLNPAEFRQLAEKIRPYTDYLYLHVLGEPLMHPALKTLLDICRELSFRVVITTNGTLLPAQETVLLSSPALYKINVSLHSFEANAPGDFRGLSFRLLFVCKKGWRSGKARGSSTLESGRRDDEGTKRAERRDFRNARVVLSPAVGPKYVGLSPLRPRVRPLRRKIRLAGSIARRAVRLRHVPRPERSNCRAVRRNSRTLLSGP